jgi:DNA-binding CsgD family transcriptional regulator
MVKQWNPLGIFDGVGVTASDGTGRLVTFVARLPVVSSLSLRTSAQYGRVAAHVAAGWRLRRSLAREPAAVLTTAGKVVHAEGNARDARERLRDAAIAMDRARGSLRREDDDAALGLWRVLVDGEWSLIDQFDRDGRRFIVAHKNDPQVTDPRALTLRERQVLACVAMGHPGKLIAYSLGVSPSSVSMARRTAMRKLGLQTTADVVRLFAEAQPPAPSQER